jgi:hypothetical protein
LGWMRSRRYGAPDIAWRRHLWFPGHLRSIEAYAPTHRHRQVKRESQLSVDGRISEPGESGRHRPDQGRRTALRDAASVAALLITTEALVAEKPKKRQLRRCQRAAWETWTSEQEAFHHLRPGSGRVSLSSGLAAPGTFRTNRYLLGRSATGGGRDLSESRRSSAFDPGADLVMRHWCDRCPKAPILSVGCY